MNNTSESNTVISKTNKAPNFYAKKGPSWSVCDAWHHLFRQRDVLQEKQRKINSASRQGCGLAPFDSGGARSTLFIIFPSHVNHFNRVRTGVREKENEPIMMMMMCCLCVFLSLYYTTKRRRARENCCENELPRRCFGGGGRRRRYFLLCLDNLNKFIVIQAAGIMAQR